MLPRRLLAQSFRMTVRDARAGEVRLLCAALAVAVASLTSVGFFVDRAQRALQRDAAMFLGADLVLESDRPIEPSIRARAESLGLATAQTVTFPSMVASDAHADRSVLVAVKAVSPGYPLRGALSLRRGQGSAAADGGPPKGGVWIDPQLRDALDLPGEGDGARVHLGESVFTVAGVIAAEPDRGGQLVAFAPRVMIDLDDLAATGLVQPASRVSYRDLVSGEPVAVADFAGWLRPRLQRGQRVQTLEQGRPDLHAALERARQYLTLVALLAALLAAVAVATAARRFTQRRLDSCALLRCLGLQARELLALFALQFLWIGGAACLAGAVLGLGLHYAIVRTLAGLLPSALPAPSLAPAVQGLVCGMVLLAGFALPPVIRLRRVTPLRVLRRDRVAMPDPPTAAAYAFALASFVGLLIWLSADVRLALVTAAAFAGAAVVFAVVAWGWLQALAALRLAFPGLAPSVRFALAALGRRPWDTVLQITALSFGLCALLVMAVVRGDLLRQWHAQVPADAPNRFIINIQPDQAADVARRLRQLGIADATLYPMVRGRLVAVNGRPVDSARYEGDRARGLVEREFNLSYAAEPPGHNRIVQGRWFAADAAELSIEQGIARTLGIGLGDQLSFDVAGQVFQAACTSVRELSWDSMKVNFFIITSPALLQDRPQTYITSIYVPPGSADPAAPLVREFRNLTVIDTGVVLGQIRSLLDQVSRAVQVVFLFALLAGVLVLYAALSASQDERRHEAGLLRALGATRSRLWRAQIVELAAIGATAGTLAGIGAGAIGALLAHQVLHFDYALTPGTWIDGALLGIACALAGGTLALRRVVATPPAQVLREL